MTYWNLLQTRINPPKEIEKKAVFSTEFTNEFTKVAKALDMTEEEIKVALESLKDERRDT